MNSPSQTTLPVRVIVPGKNPRQHFDPAQMSALEQSLRAEGVIQPIIVRPIEGAEQFEIVAGERRWRAAKNVLGDNYPMPVVIRTMDDTQAEAVAVIENHHRADMSPAEEAQAAKRQVMRHHGDKEGAAQSLGWSVGVLERRLALLTCTPAVLAALTERKIQLGHAELLAGTPPDKQETVLAIIIERKVSVALLKEQLGRYARRLTDAIFDSAPCSGCAHNSARQAGLFGESLGEGYCQHPTHFEELTQAVIDKQAEVLRDQYPSVKVIHAGDGFTPLPLVADGERGVGPAQHGACQGCASFGCAISALPGRYGEVTHGLCFDAACHSKNVLAWRKQGRVQAEPVRQADEEVDLFG